MTVDLVGWAIGAAGLLFAAYELRRGNRLEGRLDRMERLLANRAVEDTPEELVRRLREPLPEPPPAFVPALFGEVDPQRVADLIAALPVRERLLFTLRFHDHLTLAEIGDVFGISRERVRQIESNVIQKMRQVLGAGSE